MRYDQMRKCDFCDSPVSGNTRDGKRLDFHRVVVERLLLDVQSINARAGLAVMFGGNEAIASVFAPSGNAATVVASRELLICDPCWIEREFQVLHDLEGRGRELPTPEADARVVRKMGGRT